MKSLLFQIFTAVLASASAFPQSVETYVSPVFPGSTGLANRWGAGVSVSGEWMVMASGGASFFRPRVFRQLPNGDWAFFQELQLNSPGTMGGILDLVQDALIDVFDDRLVVRSGANGTSRVDTFQYFEVVDQWVGIGMFLPATPAGEFGGHLDLSPDGSRLTVTQEGFGLVYLYDWDPTTGWQLDTVLEAPPGVASFGNSACSDGDLVLVSGVQNGGDRCFAFERDAATGVWSFQYSFPTAYASIGELNGDLAAGRDRLGFWIATRTGSGLFQQSYNEPVLNLFFQTAGGPDIEDGAVVVGAPVSEQSGRVYVYQDLSCAGGFVRTHSFSTPSKGLSLSDQAAYFGYGVEIQDGHVYAGIPNNAEPGTSQPFFVGGVGVFELPLDCNGNGVPDVCDIAAGEPDIDGDGFPDSCDQIGQRYCDPNVAHSGNISAAILVEGSADALLADVRLSMIDLPQGQFGIFLAGRNPASVPMAGGSPGTLCVGPPFARMQSPFQGHSGPEGRINLTIDTQAIPLSTGVSAILPGETWFFQGWFRDNGSSGFTDAMSVGFF